MNVNRHHLRRRRRHRRPAGGRRRPFALKKKDAARRVAEVEEEAKRILARAAEDAEKIKREAAIAAKESDLGRQAEFEHQTREQRKKITRDGAPSHQQGGEPREALPGHRAEGARLLPEGAPPRDQGEGARGARSEDRRGPQEGDGRARADLRADPGGGQGQLIQKIEDEARIEAIQTVRRIEEEAREKAAVSAREIIIQAIQRSAAEHVVETTVSVVDLPSEDMKGRIIGREGRNIRALEQATGVDIIVDDTPEAVILSSFDPVRRELARLSIEKLVMDGRIHPARIEEIVEKVKADLEQKIKQEGESAVLELKVHNVHPELIKLLGKLQLPDELRPERPPALQGGGHARRP